MKDKMYRYLLGLLVLISFSGCNSLSELEELSNVEATGIVRNAITQQPLDSAIVTLYEDNEGPFMGMHRLQETRTNASGAFTFNFEYKEGPYKLYVYRKGYRYTRNITDKFFGLSAGVEYQEVAGLDNSQNFTFDMFPEATLYIKLKNIPPMYEDDQVKIEVGKKVNGEAPFVRHFEGMVDMDLVVGVLDGKAYVPIKYEVRENNVWRTVIDSVAVQPFKITHYQLHF